jgi:hypothetical protein
VGRGRDLDGREKERSAGYFFEHDMRIVQHLTLMASRHSIRLSSHLNNHPARCDVQVEYNAAEIHIPLLNHMLYPPQETIARFVFYDRS